MANGSPTRITGAGRICPSGFGRPSMTPSSQSDDGSSNIEFTHPPFDLEKIAEEFNHHIQSQVALSNKILGYAEKFNQLFMEKHDRKQAREEEEESTPELKSEEEGERGHKHKCIRPARQNVQHGSDEGLEYAQFQFTSQVQEKPEPFAFIQEVEYEIINGKRQEIIVISDDD